MFARLFAALSLALLGACPSANEDPAQGSNLTLSGSYSTTGSWDLSGPLGGNTTPGDVAADLLLEELVNRLGVPSLAKDKAFELLSDLGHDAIAAEVNANLPADWKEGGSTRQALAAVLGTMQRDTTFELALADDHIALSGRSLVTELRVEVQGQTLTVPLTEVFGDQVTLAADLTGEALSNALFQLDEHNYALQFSSLVDWILSDHLNVDLDAVRNQIRAEIDCPGLIAKVTDDQGGLSLEVQSVGYTIAADNMAQICAAIEAALIDSVLGLFERDSTLSLKGRVHSEDGDDDGVVDSLRSDADFSGHFGGFPGPVDPVVTATFTGTR